MTGPALIEEAVIVASRAWWDDPRDQLRGAVVALRAAGLLHEPAPKDLPASRAQREVIARELENRSCDFFDGHTAAAIVRGEA